MENNDDSAATSSLPDVPIYASDVEMLRAGHVKQTHVNLILDGLHIYLKRTPKMPLKKHRLLLQRQWEPVGVLDAQESTAF
jgi:hypothetical protein